jgi:hypothetical protein
MVLAILRSFNPLIHTRISSDLTRTILSFTTHLRLHTNLFLPSLPPNSLIPHIIRARMEEITLRTNIQIRDNANLRIINIHHRKLGHTPISPQLRIINRPKRLRRSKVGIGISIRVEVGDERYEPVFHVFGDGGVVYVCGEARVISDLGIMDRRGKERFDLLGESFDSNAKAPVAPCFCVPALKISL